MHIFAKRIKIQQIKTNPVLLTIAGLFEPNSSPSSGQFMQKTSIDWSSKTANI
jgi:hypothetical protein